MQYSLTRFRQKFTPVRHDCPHQHGSLARGMLVRFATEKTNAVVTTTHAV